MYIDVDTLRPYFLDEEKAPIVNKILKENKLITSIIVVEQLLTDCEKAKKKINVLAELKKLKNLKLVPLDEKIVKEAFKLMEKYRLTFHQAIHIATPLIYKKKIISFNRGLDKIPEIERVDPFTLVGSP